VKRYGDCVLNCECVARWQALIVDTVDVDVLSAIVVVVDVG